MASLLDPLRLACFVIALAALGWAAAIAPAATAGWTLGVVGERMRHGQTFSAASVEALVAEPMPVVLGSPCLRDVMRGRVMIQARLTAEAEAALDLTGFDARMEALEAETRTLLACQPHDAFGWLTLYWVMGHRHGFQPDTLAYLAMSYRTGQREAWIAGRRNRIAALAYDKMPPPLRERAAAEWGLLVQDLMFDAAVGTLFAIAPEHHDTLFLQRHAIRPASYQMFGRHLDLRGIDIILPDGPTLRPRAFVPLPVQ
jgi:hypothetical protein